MAASDAGREADLRALYRWVDAVPLSRPRRNITRDFSDGVLVAEVVKFFFPAMVQLHSFVPASSTPQKLANWGHLNRKVLSKLNFSVPAEVIRQVVQCRPGTVEQVLLLLRQKIEEKQRQVRAEPGPAPGGRAGLVRGPMGKPPPCVGAAVTSTHAAWSQARCEFSSLQEPGPRAAQISYLEAAKAGCSKGRSGGGGCTQEPPTAAGGTESRQQRSPAPGGDVAAVRLQLAEREQALLLAQETVQILQMKVQRLEQLLRLKDTRIDDLSRSLQRARLQRP
ncbi:sperm flagellar protein 1 [Cyrtonyx montezumae]|uniref:sperm flagellar protein 1 n=1 Tax=Cyrtonyx montezumae TaxID=9017 RepID=UPI0032DBCBFC